MTKTIKTLRFEDEHGWFELKVSSTGGLVVLMNRPPMELTNAQAMEVHALLDGAVLDRWLEHEPLAPVAAEEPIAFPERPPSIFKVEKASWGTGDFVGRMVPREVS